MSSGYYRFPTIHENLVVFVCEDDLWAVDADGGIARRLTANNGETSWPRLSPDGRYLAYTGREEGQPEIYLMPAEGGASRRLTYLGNRFCQTVGWTKENHIIFAHSGGQPFGSMLHLNIVDLEGNPPKPINLGPARDISYGPNNGLVIGRNNNNPAHWKRYRGGTAGQIWIDQFGDQQFRPLINLQGNLHSPIWLGERIYFLSDHEGIANLYSCLPSGEMLHRHTNHDVYYARNASSDGQKIVYHAGADLYIFDPLTNISTKIKIDFLSSQTQRSRKFVSASYYLGNWSLHPEGHSVAITTRGKPFTFTSWEGAVQQYGDEDGSRYRLLNWSNDGLRLIAVTDAEGEENFVVMRNVNNGFSKTDIITGLDIGRPIDLKVNPKKDQILFSNHRHELLCLDLGSKSLTLVDRGKSSRITGFNWSPDGEWAVYSVSISLQVSILKLWSLENNENHRLTKPVLHDVAPAFDPEGKYIYFLSYREFDPVYDNMHFDLNFPQGVKPYLITLQEDLPSPFVPISRPPGQNAANEKSKENNKAENEDNAEKEADEEEKKNSNNKVKIDLEGIENRIIAFPVKEGLYGRILGTKDGKVLYSRFPVEGALNRRWLPSTPPAKGTIYIYDFKEQEEERLISGISGFKLTSDGATLIYRSGNRLRVLNAGKKPESSSKQAGRKSGWLDLNRVKVSVVPAQEWRQMYREAWRLQRDQFWTSDMSEVDWIAVYERYWPLLERVASRAEFSDLTWEMQGELGTSHAYEFGGDYRAEPNYRQGYLGADFAYDSKSDSWRIIKVVQGDSWSQKADSPLNQTGSQVAVNEHILAINGRRLSRALSPQKALVGFSGQEVQLTIAANDGDNNEEGGGSSTRSVVVKTLQDETAARYREWVEDNRCKVHEATAGRIGYVHIPDMGPLGYAEFHRGYLAEVDREGLIVDVRYNGGGHVSQLILEKLARRRVGYGVSRWGQVPSPYPTESVIGPMVTLTNEFAGSDGDIFSHSFKLMGLGPLIGTRTWGGVVGIYPRHLLVDGTVTTQPEYSFWFEDVGWGVENYGTDPDVVIDNKPQDYINGVDAQLDKSIAEISRMLEENPPVLPSFDERPNKALPELPPL